MTYVDPNGQAATWLKNNPLDALYYGLMGLSFVPGLNIVASIGMMTIDLAKGDYTSLAMDSLGVVIPGAAASLKLSYDGVKAIVDGLRVTNEVRNTVNVETNLERTVEVSKEIKSSVDVGAKITETASQETKYEVAKAKAEKSIADLVDSTKLSEYVELAPDQQKLTDQLASTFSNSEYATVVTKTDVKLFRTSGGRATVSGGYATTEKAASRIDAKIKTALLPEWGNSREFEHTIIVPKGTTLNIGKVAPQKINSTGTVLEGGADQVLMPLNWYQDHPEWVVSTSRVPIK